MTLSFPRVTMFCPFRASFRRGLAPSATKITEKTCFPTRQLPRHKQVAPHRHQRSLFILDLAVPRDFDPQIGDALGVYLYSVDDLKDACQRHQNARQLEMPAAEKIVQQESDRFFAEVHHRITAPVISGLRQGLEQPKKAELERLFHKLPELDDQAREEISQFADRLVNKMLHPPMQSLREASENGTPNGLLDAVKRLFQLQD